MIVLDTHAWLWWLADRIILATARRFGCRLVTRDERLLGFEAGRGVW